jgi:hypothetical protein
LYLLSPFRERLQWPHRCPGVSPLNPRIGPNRFSLP